jgi:hypothetical protein
VGTIRKFLRSYGILGPVLLTLAIVALIVGMVWAAHHDKII